MSQHQSTKREYSIWDNGMRRWYAGLGDDGQLCSYKSWQLPPSFREIATGKKAPYYVSHKQAQEWMKWLSRADLSIQQRGTYKEIRTRLAAEQQQIKATSTHGIWDTVEGGGAGDWIYSYADELPKSVQQKYRLNENADGTFFVSAEDVVKWYYHLMANTEPEDAHAYSIQLRSTPKKVIRRRSQEEKRRRKFAENHL